MQILKYILSLSLLLVATSCEEVIDLELDTVPPRLVIDALINWEKGTNGSNQTIKLSLTAPFFSSNIPPATGATVYITDTHNNTFDFIEQNNDGIYINNNFIPEINGVYNLTIQYNGETYTATEKLMPVVDILYVDQKNDGGFSGNEIELKAFYTDPQDVDNYYLFEFDILKFSTTYLQVYEDEFTDGNTIFGFYSNEDLEIGDDIEIKNYGISKQTFEFYLILLEQTDENGGGPFSSQPATVRGNCINQTNPKNYPLGYFRLSEVSVFNYTIQ